MGLTDLASIHDCMDFESRDIVQSDLFISVQNLEGSGHRSTVDYAGGKCKLWHCEFLSEKRR